MAMEDYEGEEETVDESDDNSTINPRLLTLLSSAQTTTTPEAQLYARKILDGLSAGPSEEEGSLVAALEKKAATNREILAKARERLVSQRYPTAMAWLKAAQALGSPTRTGTMGETAGNLAGALQPFVEEQFKFNEGRNADLAKIDQAIANTDSDLMRAKLELLKNRMTSTNRLSVEALKTMGRTTGKSNSRTGRNMSPEGKRAVDEGFIPDTPEFNRRVKELVSLDVRNKQAQAGVDENPINPEEKQALATQYGVPILAQDPYATMSTKRRAAAEAIDQRDARKQLDALDTAAGEARTAITQADRFMKLNEDYPTGWLAGKVAAFGKDAQEMDAITSELSRKIRTPGEGSTSDFDAKQFVAATFGRGKKYTANKNIATAFKARQQNIIDRNDFMNNYAVLNGGSLQGAQAFWNQYLNDNPIFDPSKPGEYELNPNRTDYRSYFRSKTQRVRKAEGGIIDKARTVGQGATLGFEDELEGMFSDDPNATKNARASVLREAEKNPISSTVERGSGAALLVAGIQAARRMGMTDAAIRLIPRSELLRLALAGGTTGALYGLGSGEGENREDSTLMGGVTGLIGGPLAGLATKYGIIGAGNLINRHTGTDPITSGDLRILEALERDKNPDVGGRMQDADRLRIPTTMGTSGGENLQALGKAAIRQGGNEADELATDAARRMSGSRGRVEERINQSLKPDEYFGELDKLTSALYENAKPLYEKAYSSHPKIQSEKLLQLLETDAGERAVKEAMQFYNNIPGKKIGQADALNMVKNPSLEFFDKVKQGFDQLIAKEENQGPTPLGKTMRALRSQLVSQLDEQAPEYKEARAQYKGDLEVRDALQMGREQFNKLTPEEIRRAVGGMSFAERDAFRSGVAQKLFEVINAPAGDYNAAHRIIASPATAAKLEAIFEKPSEFKVFKSALERELEEFAKTKELASAAGGARLARASNDPSLIGKLGSSLGDVSYKNSLAGNILNLMRMKPDMSEETAEEVAKTLRTTDSKQARDYLRRLTAKEKRTKALKRRAGKAGMAAAILTGALTAPDPVGKNLEDEE